MLGMAGTGGGGEGACLGVAAEGLEHDAQERLHGLLGDLDDEGRVELDDRAQQQVEQGQAVDAVEPLQNEGIRYGRQAATGAPPKASPGGSGDAGAGGARPAPGHVGVGGGGGGVRRVCVG